MSLPMYELFELLLILSGEEKEEEKQIEFSLRGLNRIFHKYLERNFAYENVPYLIYDRDFKFWLKKLQGDLDKLDSNLSHKDNLYEREEITKESSYLKNLNEDTCIRECIELLESLLKKRAKNFSRVELNSLFHEYYRITHGEEFMVYLFCLKDYEACLERLKKDYEACLERLKFDKLLEEKAIEKFNTEMGYAVNTLPEVYNLLELIPEHKDVLESLRKETERTF